MDGVKDIHRENTFPNKTEKLTKSMNMNIWVKIKSTVFLKEVLILKLSIERN